MKRSTNVIVSNLSSDNILFSTFYTGLVLLFRKKLGGCTAPHLAPPLATALKLFTQMLFYVASTFSGMKAVVRLFTITIYPYDTSYHGS